MFGDSLSDTGNIAELNRGVLEPLGLYPLPWPPFYENRLSNGPVAVDVLAGLLGLDARAWLDFDSSIGELPGTNYAIAGARARDKHEDPIDLADQVLHFLYPIPPYQIPRIAPDVALYMVMIGGNDVRDAADILFSSHLPGGPSEEIAEIIVQTMIKDAVQKIASNLKMLRSAGAKTFYVVNAPNIGLIPETLLKAAYLKDTMGIDGYSRDIAKLTEKFNKKLRNTIHKFDKKHDANVLAFNLYEYSNWINKNHEILELENVTDFCVQWSLETLTIDVFCGFQEFNSWAFFDPIHPSGVVHNLIGQELFTKLSTPE